MKDSTTSSTQEVPQASYNVLDGTQSQTDPAPSVETSVASYPSDLVLRHLPGPSPWITDPGIADVTTFGADPTGYKDSTAGIQAAVQASDEVFLPHGDYFISGTIQLRQNTRIFGVPGFRTRIMGFHWPATQGVSQPYIRTYAGEGQTYVGDLLLDLPNQTADQSYLEAIEWQTGRSSIQNQVAINLEWTASSFTGAPVKLARVLHHGGGRWYGAQYQGNTRAAYGNGQFGFLSVESTQDPLTIYGSNPEHAGGPFYQLSGAANVRVLGMKTETHELATVTSSSNIMFASITANGLPEISMTGASNSTIASWTYFANAPATGTAISNDGTSYTAANAYSLFRVGGSFDESPFPHCGDGTCDGAETSATCSEDCGAADGGAGSSDGGVERSTPD